MNRYVFTTSFRAALFSHLSVQMWETAEKAGVRTANLMWCVVMAVAYRNRFRSILEYRPGPPRTTSGASPTYFVPWKVCYFRPSACPLLI